MTEMPKVLGGNIIGKDKILRAGDAIGFDPNMWPEMPKQGSSLLAMVHEKLKKILAEAKGLKPWIVNYLTQETLYYQDILPMSSK